MTDDKGHFGVGDLLQSIPKKETEQLSDRL